MKSVVKKSNQVIKNYLLTGVFAALLSTFAAMAPPVIAEQAPASEGARAEQQISTVNINEASALELEALNGVGEKKAAAIVTYREANGKFQSVDQLAEVKGIGPATIEKNRANISL